MSFFSGGRPITKTFTPGVNGTVRVIVVFDMWWSAGPCSAAAFCEQSAVSTYGARVGGQRLAWQSMRVEHVFGVVAGSPVTVGLAAYGPGLRWLAFENMALTAEFTPS